MSTAEIVTRPTGAAPAQVAPRPAYYQGFDGAASQPFDDYARMVLAEPVDPRDVEIRTDGIVYLSGVWYRRQLTRAFGAGGWAIVPRSAPQKMGEMVVYHGALVILGRFVSEAMGECETRAKMSYASSLEGARTDCITRCCKDLGMASELWDRTWRDAWIRDCARKVPDKNNPGKSLWYKNDGAEHDPVPLFVPRQDSPRAAAPPPPPTPPPSSGGVTSDPKGASVATADSTTVRVGAATASKSSGQSNKRTSGAADIKHDGRMATGEQVKLIHVLRSKIPSWDPKSDDAKSKWADTLCVYPRQPVGDCLACKGTGNGKKPPAKCGTCYGRGKECPPVEHSNELSIDQATHLIDRLQARVDKLAAAEREIRSGNDGAATVVAAVIPPVDLLEALHAEFPTATEEDEWLHSLGYQTADDIPEESRQMVLLLLRSIKQPAAYATNLTKARTLGHVR